MEIRKLLESTTTILINPTINEVKDYVKKEVMPSYKLNNLSSNSVVLKYIIDSNDNLYLINGLTKTHQAIKTKVNKNSKEKIKEQYKGRLVFYPKEGKFLVNKNHPLQGRDNKNLKKLINEDIAYVKFRYTNAKHDPVPKVKVLDFTYPGRPGQKTYGKRDDLLGWNLNYSNSKYAEKAIDDITSFAKLLSANKDEMYKRIKYFFPDQAKLIRRYKRQHIKGLKQKIRGLWRNKDYGDLMQYNQEAF